MAYYSKLNVAQQNKMTGHGQADASDGVLYKAFGSSRLKPSEKQRSLIIGVGGQGVKAVAAIKNKVKSTFENWEDKIGFLAIDTDDKELKSYTVFNQQKDVFSIPAEAGIKNRYNIKGNRSDFTNSWINPEFMLTSLSYDDGAGQNRQACRAKLFDCSQAASPVDSQIVERIKKAGDGILQAFNPLQDMLNVHILCGTAGGTGSGALVEIAHFVRRAFDVHGDKVKILGYMFLPDVTERYHEGKASDASTKCNGYAALKELDYYYSIGQREEQEVFSMNNQAPMSFSVHNKLYDKVYLVSGSNGSAVLDKNKNAIDTAAEYIANQLTTARDVGNGGTFLTVSFMSNAEKARSAAFDNLYKQNGMETPYAYGEDSYDYCGLGVAGASVPEQTIKMYMLTKILRTIYGKSDAFAAPEAFKSFDADYMDALEAEMFISKLITAGPGTVEKKLLDLCSTKINLQDDASVERGDIIVEGATRALEGDFNASRNSIQQLLPRVDEFLNSAYQDFLNEMKVFLKAHGPKAFKGIWNGVDRTGAVYKNGKGLKELISEWKIISENSLKVINPTGYNKKELVPATDDVKQPVLGRLPARSQRWLEVYKTYLTHLRAKDTLVPHTFAAAGVYTKNYLQKIEAFAEQVCEFADVMEGLYLAYNDLGQGFDTYDGFSGASLKENATAVNILQDETDYRWAKKAVDNCAETTINYLEVKDSIIDDFFEDPKAWTEYDESHPEKTPRRRMDEILAKYVANVDEQLSVVSYIEKNMAGGKPLEKILSNLIYDLKVRSKPLFNANANIAGVLTANTFSYLVVPETVFASENGPKIRTVFEEICQKENITICYIESGDRIIMYTCYSGLPLTLLADLPNWQLCYEKADKKMLHSNESGKGDYDPKTGLAWKDYPSLVLTHDPEQKDQYGQLTTEGIFYQTYLNPLFEEALKLGLIKEVVETTVQDGKKVPKYSYVCYLFNKTGWDYSVNTDDYDHKDAAGLYLIGEELFEYIAEKNHGTMEDIRRPIALKSQEKFTAPLEDHEEAIRRAKRTLRRYVPMFIALKKTVPMYKDLVREMEAHNDEIRRNALTDHIPHLIAAGVLEVNDKKAWSIVNYPAEGDKPIPVCKLTALAQDGNPLYDRELKYEILCRAFAEKFADDPTVAGAYKRGFALLEDDANLYGPELLKRLEVFEKEAQAFTQKYCGESIQAERNLAQLAKELRLSEQETDDLCAHYEGVLSLARKIRDEM